MALVEYIEQIDLFDRTYRLQVNDRLITEQQVRFAVRRSLRAKVPNTCEIEIANLAPDTRKAMDEMKSVYVQLEAGYTTGTTLIFHGDLTDVWTERASTEWITTLTSHDGGKAKRVARVQKAFPANTTLVDALTAIAQSLGVGLGNLSNVAAAAKFLATGQRVLPMGFTASGNAAEQLQRLTRACGLSYSVQDGQLQLLGFNAALAEAPVVLTSSTGLLESPEAGKDHIIRCKTLLIPGLYPGRLAELTTAHVTGMYRIETVTYRGDLYGNEWGAQLELSAKKS